MQTVIVPICKNKNDNISDVGLGTTGLFPLQLSSASCLSTHFVLHLTTFGHSRQSVWRQAKT